MPDRSKSEQEYRIIIQASMDSFWKVGADGRIIDCNEAACAMLGYSRDEMLTLFLHDVDLIEDEAKAAEHVRMVIAQGHDRFETQHRRKDGSSIDVEVSAYCVPGAEAPLLFAFSRDISARKAADKALRESEARLASVLRAAPVGIGVLQQRIFQDVNETMTVLTGYRREELLGQSARMLYANDADYEYVGTEKYRRIREQGVGSVETRWRCKDGRIIDVFLSSTPITPGDLTGKVVFTAENITERKQAETSLRESEELNRSTLQALPAHIAVIGGDGCIIGVNQAWNDFARSNAAGNLPTVAVGANYLEIVRRAADQDELARRAIDGIEKVLNGSMAQFELEYPCHGPSEQRWFRMTVVPLGIITRCGLVISHSNITERKQAEDALRESEESYRSLVATSLDAVLMTAPDGRILLANEAAARMFECSVEEVCRRGRNGVVDLTDPRLPLLVAERARTGRVHGELTFVRSDGTKFPGEVSSVLYGDRNGEVRSSMVIRDISERKLAEAERQAAMERQRDTLVREVHHRIKNHLQGVSGMLRGMVSNYPESAIPLGKAIEKVRAIAQVYGLQSSCDDARVRLCDLVRTSAENMIGAVSIVCDLPPAGNEAILAPEETVPLALVVNELLTNALKHIESVDPQRPVKVEVSIREQAACVEIRSGPAQFPQGFDFVRQKGIGTGLELVAALLPPQGSRLEFRQEADEVLVRLVLESPVISAINRLA
ncbi:MAG: PAS domain S-box protein [Pseudomonadota bacterium]